jgi:hypothetical protein
MSYDYRNKPKRVFNKNDAFIVVRGLVPKKTAELLRLKGEDLRERMARLIAIALDNEMECEPAFRYSCDMPETPYVEHQYVHEAGKILKFLEKFEGGTSLETLMLCRRDIGILNKSVFMLAFRELIKVDLIESFHPPDGKYARPMGYRRWRPTQVDPKTGEKFKSDEDSES